VALGLVLLAGGALGGCADIGRATSLPPVNPESPVAGAVTAAAMRSYPRPSFESVPPKPLNIPPPYAVKTAVIDMVRCRRAYEAWVASHPALVSGTKGFGESLQARLDNNPDDRPTPADEAAAEANAAKLRAYAAPPPPITPGAPLDASQAAPPAARAPSRPSHAAAPVQIAAAAPAPTAPAGAPAAVPPPAPAAETVAIVQPSTTPDYRDPLLAHCQ